MNSCLECGAKTELYVLDRPLCVKCATKEDEERRRETSGNLSARLSGALGTRDADRFRPREIANSLVLNLLRTLARENLSDGTRGVSGKYGRLWQV
jgi:hypothetical protein